MNIFERQSEEIRSLYLIEYTMAGDEDMYKTNMTCSH